MLEYELSQIIHTLTPYLIVVISVLTGVVISNVFWTRRIYRYADREIVKTLEYQKNKIDALNQEIVEKNSIISELKGYLKIAKMSAAKILGVTGH